jgi:hypothetical protein
MTAARVAKLEALGFAWELSKKPVRHLTGGGWAAGWKVAHLDLSAGDRMRSCKRKRCVQREVPANYGFCLTCRDPEGKASAGGSRQERKEHAEAEVADGEPVIKCSYSSHRAKQQL